MKVIFLDIDGVMNDELAYMAWQENQDKEDYDDSDVPTDAHMAQLKKLVDTTGAEIVLSSSWRCSIWGMRTILERFSEYGLRLLSVTDDGVPESVLRAAGFSDMKPQNTSRRTWDGSNELMVHDRGAEIAGWMLRRKDVDSFVIIDDEDADIVQYYPNNFVKTSYMTGLTDEDVEKSVYILNEKAV